MNKPTEDQAALAFSGLGKTAYQFYDILEVETHVLGMQTLHSVWTDLIGQYELSELRDGIGPDLDRKAIDFAIVELREAHTKDRFGSYRPDEIHAISEFGQYTKHALILAPVTSIDSKVLLVEHTAAIWADLSATYNFNSVHTDAITEAFSPPNVEIVIKKIRAGL